MKAATWDSLGFASEASKKKQNHPQKISKTLVSKAKKNHLNQNQARLVFTKRDCICLKGTASHPHFRPFAQCDALKAVVQRIQRSKGTSNKKMVAVIVTKSGDGAVFYFYD